MSEAKDSKVEGPPPLHRSLLPLPGGKKAERKSGQQWKVAQEIFIEKREVEDNN